MTQFCVEEAAFHRLEFAERRASKTGLPADVIEEYPELAEAVEPSLHEQLGSRHQALMQEAQD